MNVPISGVDGYAFALEKVCDILQPREVLPVSEWAERNRVVSSQSGSPFPGRWSNANNPILVEPLEVCGYDHPARTVTLMASAQSGKSEVALNAVLAATHQTPVPWLIALPGEEEKGKYNAVKLSGAIEETPVLANLVLEQVSRSNTGSTLTRKKFPGGTGYVLNANAARDIQMISTAINVYEEVTGYNRDVGGRGSPILQLQARQKAWLARGAKSIFVSTPGIKNDCTITAQYEAGDQRRPYVPCPQCGDFQVLEWDHLDWSQPVYPHGAFFACRSNGCVIEHRHRHAMVSNLRWVPCYESADEGNPAPPAVISADLIDVWKDRDCEGRDPSYWWWQVYTPFSTWDHVVEEYLKAGDDGQKLKAFYQQTLGLPFEEKGEAPAAERLIMCREDLPERAIPPGVLYLTGFVDVQDNRLEWRVDGFDRDRCAYVIDFGILEGKTSEDEVWRRLDEVVAREYPDAYGKAWGVDWWGIDAGYRWNMVHLFRARHGNPNRIIATQGAKQQGEGPLGGQRAIRYKANGCTLEGVAHYIGAYDLKLEVYERLGNTLMARDSEDAPKKRYRLPMRCDLNFFQQMTSEALVNAGPRTNGMKRWVKFFQRNEQLDLAVGCLALFRALTDGKPDSQWLDRMATRLPRETLPEGAVPATTPQTGRDRSGWLGRSRYY